jgi:hypothetical protein
VSEIPRRRTVREEWKTNWGTWSNCTEVGKNADRPWTCQAVYEYVYESDTVTYVWTRTTQFDGYQIFLGDELGFYWARWGEWYLLLCVLSSFFVQNALFVYPWRLGLGSAATPSMQQIHKTRPDPTSRNCQAPTYVCRSVNPTRPQKRGPITPGRGKAVTHSGLR